MGLSRVKGLFPAAGHLIGNCCLGFSDGSLFGAGKAVLGGLPIQLVWRLDVHGDRYKIGDVSINGLSMALSQRETLAKMIQRHGGQVAGLLEAMRVGETAEISQISPADVRWESAWTYVLDRPNTA